MAESAIPVATEIAKYLVAPVERRFCYLWNYKTNLDNLEKEVEKLKADRDTVQLLIKPEEDPLPNVKLWQERTDRSIFEVSKVVGDNPEQANIQCCKGFSCPNLINRYQRGKNAAEKLKEVLKLEQEAAPWLTQIANRTNIPDDPWLRSGDGYEAFDSRSSVLKNIIDALCDPDVNMVGIYGMGGIGKTTLARKVAKHIQQDDPSHVMVFVEVSITPNIKNIQQAIGGKLGLKFHDETEDGQARALYDQLKKGVTVPEGADNSGEKKKEKKILLILDNIWGKINLEKVGIPLGGDCKGLKLLLTTRSIHVLKNQMNSHCNFPVEALEEAEAWNLFKSTAGMCVDHPDLKNIAPEVAKKCGNMPLAIVTVASALKDKEESTWSTALNELKNPSLEGFEETMTKEVYTCIKFSYDHLETTEIKEIFLLCSRMGRTYDASIQDLFMYGLGLGFFRRFKTLEEAQCKVEDLVKKLKGNSLLLDAPNETRVSLQHVIPDGERFAMHDVICDVARSIDRQKGNVCNVIDDAIPCRWAKTNILKNCISITLHNISGVPKDLRLQLPQLEFFYMKTKDSFSRITDDFFVEMPSLLVLHLIEMNLSPLPTSLGNLISLQTLCLDACKLGDIADVGKLEKLEFLSFCGSTIRELPKEMRHLTSIRLLDLNDCSKLEIIPPNLLSCFTRLAALYMCNTLVRWEDGGLKIGRILDELKHLCDHLTTLEISIPNVKMSEGLLSPQLKRYKISIGRNWISRPMNSRTLRVVLNTNDNADENADEVISQLEGIKQLELVRALRFYIDVGSKQSVSLDADSKQSVSLDALFSLESLSLQDLYFEKICNVPLAAESFCQLRTITVDGCDKLTNIFSFSIDRVLPKLQEIQVSSCKNMEEIFAIESEDDVNNTELIHEIQFSQLCSVTLKFLRQLKSFCHRVKTTSQLQLTSSTNDGEIISKDTIDIPKSLFNEKVVFPNLNSLVVCGCDNLKELFSSSMVTSFVQLQYLKISSCSLLEEMVFMEELKEEERKDTQFPLLKEMTIMYCPNFKGFISNDKIGFPSLKAMELECCPKFKEIIFNDKIGFPSLKAMAIIQCPKFKEFIFNDKVAVPNIEKLTIEEMDNLEKIWHDQLVKDSFCKLKSLKVHDCKRLLNVFPSNIYGRLLSLESLEVRECGSLQEMFDFRELSIYDSQIMLSFENLQNLRVSSCGSLKNLFSASILGKEGVVIEEAPARFLFPKLSSFQLYELPKLRSFYSGGHKVEGPVLKTSDLSHSGIHDTGEEGQMQQPFFLSLDVEIGFPSLKKMEIRRCPKLKELIFNDKIGFPSLKAMKIKHCPKFKEFIFNDKVAFPNLETLNISVISAEKIWHNQLPTISSSFQNLNRLDIILCENLKELFSSSMVNSFVQLQYLKISGCSLLEEVVFMEELKEEERKDTQFPLLKKMTIKCCRNFKGFISNDKIGFPSLKKMEIKGCDKFKEFIFNDKVAVPNIEKLKISRMNNLEKIWHDQLVKDSFCKLKSLKVHDCKRLLNVFPSNIYGRLISLESLVVRACRSLEEIFDLRELSIHDSQILLSFENLQNLRVEKCFSLKNLFSASILGKEGVVMEEAPARFLFPKLTSFQLYELPLRSFYPGRYTVAFPCLEELRLVGQQVTLLCQGQFPESLFDKLKILQVWNDESIVFPFGIIQRCQNLEELLLSRSHYKEIFPHGEDQTETKIKTLNLSYLKDLKYIWKQNSKLDLIIQHIEVLKVHTCHSLINLMQPPTSFQNPSTCFQNLTSLEVLGCDRLINMGTSLVAKSLVQLTEMTISHCEKITEVIGNHGDVIEDEIVFRELKSLMLEDLLSLTSFCSSNFTLKFPSLETLTVQRCPNMKIFSQGDLTTQKLQRVKIGCISFKLRPDYDLNTVIQQYYEQANASRKPISAKDNGASYSHHPVLMAGPAVVQE